MRVTPFLLIIGACSSDGAPAATDEALCPAFFGLPNETTGLDVTMCRPSCGDWSAPTWSTAKIDDLLGWTLLDPPAPLTADPYVPYDQAAGGGTAPGPGAPGTVCGVEVIDAQAKTYRLRTFASEAAATAAGALVTHGDACGLCSTLADLAVYARTLDLTAPVRQCGIDTVNTGFEADVSCLEGLGFTRACAQIWAYNTAHTRAACLAPCVRQIDAMYHLPNGELNDCLVCDEVKSGAVFKAVAGRTRRNTGIASALCRPCSEVQRIVHDYP